jgi:phosphate transport system protein
MVREAFWAELRRLQQEVLALGRMVENALVESVDLLKRQDLEGAKRLIADDRLINEKRFEIEADAMVLIATQQPMASDLRILAAILEIVTELERMGDYAKGIGRICLMIGDKPHIKPLVDLPLMASKVRDMLHEALDAFVRQDVDQARAIPVRDDEIDNLYNQVYRELLTYIMADPTTIDGATHLLWVAHNLERTGDRVTNICERVVFTVTGQMVEMDSEETGLHAVP